MLSASTFRARTALFVLPLFAPVAALAEDIPLFIFAGQSNMVGFGTDSSQLTLDQAAAQPNVLYAGQQQFPVLSGNIDWQNMQAPTETGGQINSGSGFGPELTAPRTISDGLFGQKVGAVKWAVNGTGLRMETAVNNFDWHPDSPNEIFQAMVDQTNVAKAQLPVQESGTTGTVKGFFWYQGERDATDADRADVYQYNLTLLIERVRTEFADPNLPFVMAKIAANAGTHADVIRAAQENVAKYVKNVALVETDDLGHMSNPFADHLNTQGTYDVGIRMGRAYAKLKDTSIPTGPASMNSVVNGGFEGYAMASGFGNFPTNGPVGGGTFYPVSPVPAWKADNESLGYTLVNEAQFSPAAEGEQFLSLQNSFFGPGNGGAKTDVTLTPGQSYTLVFEYSAISFGEDFAQWKFALDSAATGSMEFTINQTVAANQMEPWTTASITFNATVANETLRFVPTQTNNVGFFGPAIDNVRLVQGSVWDDNTGGNNWDDSSNFLVGATPDGEGAIANFLSTSTNKTVNVTSGDNAVTAASLRFDSEAGYTLSTSNGSKIVMKNSGQRATLLAARGSHAINVQLDLEESLDVGTEDVSTITVNGQLNQGGGARSLRKFGTGSLVLTHGSNNYTGLTEVVGGTLALVNGSSTNPIASSSGIRVFDGGTLIVTGLSGGGLTLTSGQTLSGDGMIRGGITATASGVGISPGRSAGIMTFAGAGNIALNSNATITVEIGGNGDSTGTAGMSYDQIVIDGSGKSFGIGGAKLNLVALPGLVYNQQYKIVTVANGASIDFTTVFNDLTASQLLIENAIHNQGSLWFELDYETDEILITFVPEPSSVAVGLLAACGMLRRRTRRCTR